MPQADSKNSTGQEQQQTAQNVPYPSPYPQYDKDDVIDFYELWISLWKRKWLIIAMTVVAALGSIVYALKQQHIYKAEALLFPPNAKNIQSINHPALLGTVNVLNQGHLNAITSEDVFIKFRQNLISLTVLGKFIQEHGLMNILAPGRTSETRDEDIHRGFSELIKLGGGKESTSVSIELHDAEIAAQWINDLIVFVDKETIAMLVDDLQNSITNKIRDIEYTIASKRKMAKLRREDQIIRYREAAVIAENLGIKRRVDATNIIQNTQMNVDIATATTPLYYLGFEALSTEISVLKSRKSDDPFIGGLRDLQEKLALMRSINLAEVQMNSVRIDQAAYPPKNPIKPNRRMIVSLGTVVGLFSGIFLAFFFEYFQKMRIKNSE